MNFSLVPFDKKIKKPWGQEIIFSPENLPYTGKQIYIKAGKKLSLQYHDKKIETVYLISGKAKLWLEDATGKIKKVLMKKNKGYTIQIMQKHRIESIEECIVIEVSTPEVGTTVRIEDDYNRKNESELIRKEKNRGWK